MGVVMAAKSKQNRKYSEIGELSRDPFGGDQVLQEVEPGPTPENPYKFTEHSENVQGSNVSGRDLQGLSGRSMFSGIAKDQELWQDRLPMKDVKVATGDLTSYESSVTDPYSLQGRQEIAGLEWYNGPSETTSVFDTDLIGKSMGLDDTQIKSLLRPEHETVYSVPRSTGRDEPTRSAAGVSSGSWLTEDEWKNTIEGNQPTPEDIRQAGKNVTDLRAATPETFIAGNYTSSERITDPSVYEDLPISKLERNMFTGLGMLSDSGALNLDLDNTQQLNWVAGLGESSASRAVDTGENFGDAAGRYNRIAGEDTLSNQQEHMRYGLELSDDEPDEWTGIAHKAIQLTAIGLMSFGAGAAFAPAAVAALGATAGGAATGALAGGLSSTMVQMGENRSLDEFDTKQIGIATVGGAALGATSGYLSPGTAQSAATAPTGAGLAKTSGVAALGGGIQGYQEGVAKEAQISEANSTLASTNAEKISTAQAAASLQEFDNLFGIRQNDPYMKFNVDTSSSQEGKL
jgi:hypothetical protein